MYLLMSSLGISGKKSVLVDRLFSQECLVRASISIICKGSVVVQLRTNQIGPWCRESPLCNLETAYPCTDSRWPLICAKQLKEPPKKNMIYALHEERLPGVLDMGQAAIRISE